MSNKKRTSIQQDPNIIHKGNFVISEIRSDIDGQTVISDGSHKTKTSIVTSNTNQQSTISGYLKNVMKSPQSLKEPNLSKAKED